MRFASAIWANAHPWDKFINIPCVAVEHPSELQEKDILIIHGGADISPSLYKQTANEFTYAQNTPSNRDRVEWELIQRAIEMKLLIIGICRGGQMLCAAAGGALVQHVENHGGSHTIATSDGDILMVNSIHHQMMNPQNTNHQLWAWSAPARSKVYYGQDGLISMEKEPELIFFPDIRGFAIQWHPEMRPASDKATKYLMNKLEKCYEF